MLRICQSLINSYRYVYMTTVHIPHHHGVINGLISSKVLHLAEDAVHVVKTSRDRVAARAFIRAALAALGEAVKQVSITEEIDITGNVLDEDDFHGLFHNVEGLIRKVKQSLADNERDPVVTYLKTIYRMLGNGEASGSLTPMPRDFAAAMSRFSEDSLSSPTQQRGPTHQERLEHTHSASLLKH